MLVFFAIGLILLIAVTVLLFNPRAQGEQAETDSDRYRAARHMYATGEITREELGVIKSNLGGRPPPADRDSAESGLSLHPGNKSRPAG